MLSELVLPLKVTFTVLRPFCWQNDYQVNGNADTRGVGGP